MIEAMRRAWLATTSLVALDAGLPPVTVGQWARLMTASGKELGIEGFGD
jgi:predicted AlkP superfamily phosphohydrolase/phosphomutase